MTITDDGGASAPVSFDPYSEVFFNDPYDVYKRLRDEAPVYHSDQYGGFYVLSRFEDVSLALKQFEIYSSAFGMDVIAVNSPDRGMPMMITMDPPDHDRMRGLVSKVFTPRAISALEPMIRDMQTALLAKTEGRDRFDVVDEFSAWFPLEVISTMLGVPTEIRGKLKELLERGLHREPGQIEMTEDNVNSMVESGMHYYQLTAERRAEPGEDMISRLIAAQIERPDGTVTSLDDVEITGFLTLLGGAGAETVTKAIGNAIVQFGQHPDQWQKLQDDPSLIPGAVEEILRFQPPSQYMVRKAMQDVTLHGTTIPAGSAVMVSLGAAARDERQYPDPDTFNIERSTTQILSMGYGVHSCLGAALARLECRIALELLLKRMPRFTVDTAGLRRVTMANVAGYSHVPVTVLS